MARLSSGSGQGAFGVQFDLDPPQFDRLSQRIDRGQLGAARRAVSETTRETEKALERATASAVKGRLWRAWASKTYPAKGLAHEPVGSIFVKGRVRSQGAMRAFAVGGRISARDGGMVAIPLPAAGSRGRDRLLTPDEWEARTGIKLRLVKRVGKPALLVADEAVLSGKRQVARQNSARRRATGRGNTTVPIFVIMPAVDIRQRFSIAATVSPFRGRLVQRFLSLSAADAALLNRQ